MKRIGIVLLVCLLALLSCRDEEPALAPLPAGLKAYAYFLPGTYWIYQDSATGRLDSVWVTNARIWVHTDKDRNHVYGRNEELEVRTASSASATGREYRTHRVCGGGTDSSSFVRDFNDVSPCWWIERLALRSGNRDGSLSEVFFYALRWDHPEVLQVSDALARARRHSAPQRLVGGRVFSQVVEVSTTADLSEGGVPARYWWGKGLGIVQQRLYLSSGIRTRTLPREHIVQ